MTKYAMVVDVTKCNGCYNCFLACRDEYCGNDFSPYSAVSAHDRALLDAAWSRRNAASSPR